MRKIKFLIFTLIIFNLIILIPMHVLGETTYVNLVCIEDWNDFTLGEHHGSADYLEFNYLYQTSEPDYFNITDDYRNRKMLNSQAYVTDTASGSNRYTYTGYYDVGRINITQEMEYSYNISLDLRIRAYRTVYVPDDYTHGMRFYFYNSTDNCVMEWLFVGNRYDNYWYNRNWQGTYDLIEHNIIPSNSLNSYYYRLKFQHDEGEYVNLGYDINYPLSEPASYIQTTTCKDGGGNAAFWTNFSYIKIKRMNDYPYGRYEFTIDFVNISFASSIPNVEDETIYNPDYEQYCYGADSTNTWEVLKPYSHSVYLEFPLSAQPTEDRFLKTIDIYVQTIQVDYAGQTNQYKLYLDGTYCGNPSEIFKEGGRGVLRWEDLNIEIPTYGSEQYAFIGELYCSVATQAPTQGIFIHWLMMDNDAVLARVHDNPELFGNGDFNGLYADGGVAYCYWFDIEELIPNPDYPDRLILSKYSCEILEPIRCTWFISEHRGNDKLTYSKNDVEITMAPFPYTIQSLDFTKEFYFYPLHQGTFNVTLQGGGTNITSKQLVVSSSYYQDKDTWLFSAPNPSYYESSYIIYYGYNDTLGRKGALYYSCNEDFTTATKLKEFNANTTGTYTTHISDCSVVYFFLASKTGSTYEQVGNTHSHYIGFYQSDSYILFSENPINIPDGQEYANQYITIQNGLYPSENIFLTINGKIIKQITTKQDYIQYKVYSSGAYLCSLIYESDEGTVYLVNESFTATGFGASAEEQEQPYEGDYGGIVILVSIGLSFLVGITLYAYTQNYYVFMGATTVMIYVFSQVSLEGMKFLPSELGYGIIVILVLISVISFFNK